MLRSFKLLDRILRGDATRMSELQEGNIRIPVVGLSAVIVLLGVGYGLCMGSFAMIRTGGEAHMQLIASAVKVPLLFGLTLAVTFPSLYVFNALIGSRLSIASALRLLLAALGVMLAVLASLGPIVVFFAVSTTSYPFMLLLNVLTGSAAGVLGLAFLLRTLHRLVLIQEGADWGQSCAESPPALPEPPADDSADPAAEEDGRDADADRPPAKRPGALDAVGGFTSEKAKAVFRVWMVVFALVGAQMSWVLRPFVGSPDQPFEWFRQRESNFFMAVFYAVRKLFGGE